MTWRERPFALAAIVLLIVAAFGGPSVGIPLAVAQVASLAGPSAGSSFGPVPTVALGYGLVSLAGALAVLVRWPNRTRLVVLPQGFVTVGLLGVYVAVIAEPSLLAVAAISGGATLCSLVDGGLQPSRR
jgi:hypothetical protein